MNQYSKIWEDALKSRKYRIFVDNSTMLIARADIEAFLYEYSASLSILGAEGFTFDGKYITPLIECIYDASYSKPREAAEGLIEIVRSSQDWKKAHFIELVLSEDVD